MKTMTINGKEIKTNFRSNYSVWSGNEYPKTMKVRKVPFGKTDGELLEELVSEGYTKITFYETTTFVRGYHEIYAFCK